MEKILRFIKNTEGQSLVEFALIFTFILIPLILGMIEFGWILNGQITVTNAAREGARAAAIYNLEAEGSDAVANALSSSSNVTPRTDGTLLTSINLTGESATVTVNAQIIPIIGIFPVELVPNPFPLTATAVMRIESY